MADIFISFIHEDEKVADAVKRFLHEKLEANSKVFLASDKWAIYAGEDWLKKIKDELASAKVVVLLLRKESVGRPWVNFEAGAAWLTEKVIVPVCFRDLQKDAPFAPFKGWGLLCRVLRPGRSPLCFPFAPFPIREFPPSLQPLSSQPLPLPLDKQYQSAIILAVGKGTSSRVPFALCPANRLFF